MAPFTIGKRKDEEEIYVNAQQISKGEFWQIPPPFTDFLVSVILLVSNFHIFQVFWKFSLSLLFFSRLQCHKQFNLYSRFFLTLCCFLFKSSNSSIPLPACLFSSPIFSLMLLVPYFWLSTSESSFWLSTFDQGIPCFWLSSGVSTSGLLFFWSQTSNLMLLVSCFCSHAVGLPLLAFSFFFPASGLLFLATCFWFYASGLLILVSRFWFPVSGLLLLIFCSWVSTFGLLRLMSHFQPHFFCLLLLVFCFWYHASDLFYQKLSLKKNLIHE